MKQNKPVKTEKTAKETVKNAPAEQRGLFAQNASSYLIASDTETERQKELLYRILGPVFFGEKRAETLGELSEFFMKQYGIDVNRDFCEGDEHYEEFLEAQQAIAEGMSIYSGEIGFEDSSLASLAEQVWERMEEQNKGKFRRINTLLEE